MTRLGAAGIGALLGDRASAKPLGSLVEGKVALVTGCASGIGRATAVLFAAEGARVVCTDPDVDEAEETVDLITTAGGEASFVRCDLNDVNDAAMLIAAVVEAFGRLDCAFNNDNTPGPGGRALADYDVEDFDRTVARNLRAKWVCMRFEIPQMVAQGGGAIVNSASTSGLSGSGALSAYSAANHGVIGLTRAAAIEYGSARVRVNALCPGGTRTPTAQKLFGPVFNQRNDRMPMRRLAEPSEQAEAAVWLCSDRASYVTGVALPVDGGSSCDLATTSLADFVDRPVQAAIKR